MEWYWYPLIGLIVLLAVYALAALVILIAGHRGGEIEMPGGETIEPPPRPESPRKRWRLLIERR
jgi:hypothetical protein